MWEANGKIITLLISKNRDKCEILCKQNNQEVNFLPVWISRGEVSRENTTQNELCQEGVEETPQLKGRNVECSN